MQGLPHAPCRLQPGLTSATISSLSLPPHAPCRLQRFINSTDEIEVHLCLHTPRADCNATAIVCNSRLDTLPPHAPCRLQPTPINAIKVIRGALPPHAPCRLQHFATRFSLYWSGFASTRSVQIAAPAAFASAALSALCLHTLRADCSYGRGVMHQVPTPLPPHAPCRLQHSLYLLYLVSPSFASTRSVQIAASIVSDTAHASTPLPPHAPCRLQQFICWGVIQMFTTLPPHAPCRLQRTRRTRRTRRTTFASTRSVQIAAAEMHRMQYALFRTCVESVDSFSVLNKSMLR